MFKELYKFFDKLEDKNRIFLSHYPILYAFLTGTGMILFWRGVWHTADATPILENSIVSMIVGSILLLLIGTFISSYIGNEIIISGNKKEQKVVDKIVDEAEKNLLHEFEDDAMILRELRNMKLQIAELKKMLDENKSNIVKSVSAVQENNPVSAEKAESVAKKKRQSIK